MVTVLITGVGGACGVGAVRSLKQRTDHDVVGVDMDPRAAGFHLADAGRAVPAATDETWAKELRATVEEFNVDVVVPTVDEELGELARVYQTLPDDVPVVAPRLKVIDVALDKYRTYKRLASTGHAVPETWVATKWADVDESAFPLLAKPRRGRGSRGIERVDDPDELEAHLAETEYDLQELLLQEFVKGTEYTTSVVASKESRLLGIVPKEAVRKEGSTVIGATRRSPAVRAECRSLHNTLDPQGPINVQQIVDDEGVPHTIEINPRFSSTSCLTAAAGVDEFDLLVRDATGESVSPPGSFEEDLYIQRYQDHVFVPGEEFEQFS